MEVGLMLLIYLVGRILRHLGLPQSGTAMLKVEHYQERQQMVIPMGI